MSIILLLSTNYVYSLSIYKRHYVLLFIVIIYCNYYNKLYKQKKEKLKYNFEEKYKQLL